jgi:hypothetical protein
MSREQRGQHLYPSELLNLLDSADFFKREGEGVSDDLQNLEQQILEGLSHGSGVFEGSIPQTLLSELGAEIFDTLLSGYLKWYRSSVIAVTQEVEQDCLAFAGYAVIERPHHLGLGVTYKMRNTTGGNGGPPAALQQIDILPGSVQVAIDASRAVRTAVAALKIEKTVHRMLGNPADIVRSTLQCRLETAYGYRQAIGDVGLSVGDEMIQVRICAAKPPAE